MALVTHDATSIANLALRHIGIGKPIASLSEQTENAIACAAFYQQTKEEILREFPWPFAWTYAPLDLVDGSADIATAQDFQYAYRLPADAIRVHRILGDTRQAGTESRIPFSLGSDATGGLLYTDSAPIAASTSQLQQPQLEYTRNVDESDLPSDVAQCIALKLAFYLAPALTGGDPNKLGARAYQLLYGPGGQFDRAAGAAAREQQFDPEPESEFITTRL
jgi:hypothetical protein